MSCPIEVLHDAARAQHQYIARYMSEKLAEKKQEFLRYCFCQPGHREIYDQFCVTHQTVEDYHAKVQELKRLMGEVDAISKHNAAKKEKLIPAKLVHGPHQGTYLLTAKRNLDEILASDEYRHLQREEANAIRELDALLKQFKETYALMWHKIMVLRANGLE